MERFFWNGAEDARGGANFFGMERRRREVERIFLEWSGGRAGWSDFFRNGAMDARGGADFFDMECRTTEVERIFLEWSDSNEEQ